MSIDQISATNRWPMLSNEVYNKPLMLHPAKAEEIAMAIDRHAEALIKRDPTTGDPITPTAMGVYGSSAGEKKPYFVSKGGVAVIPIHGTLTHRGSWLSAISGLVGYDQIKQQIGMAVADGDVAGILLDVDSNGGSVAGAFDLADDIRSMSGEKPIWAISNESMFSAAYLIGSAANKIVLPRTGMAGSIGVVAMLVDMTKRDEKEGVKYEPIFAGKRKVDMNPHVEISEQARSKVQSLVNSTYDLFIETVSAHRGISAEAVRGTEADIFESAQAKQLGLVDSIMTFDEAVASLEAEVSAKGRSMGIALKNSDGGKTMSKDIESGEGGTENTVTDADVQNARAEGIQEGRTAERDRIFGILNAEEATGREAMAKHLASKTNMDVEDAVAVLAETPIPEKDSANASAASFISAMEGEQPSVDADSGSEDEEATSASIVDRVVNM